MIDLTEAYAEHFPGILNFAWTRLRDRCEAEDVAQEVFARAFVKLHTLRDEAKFHSWLFTIAQNEIVTNVRARRRRRRHAEAASQDERTSDDALIEARERCREVAELIARLTPSRRRALGLNVAGVTHMSVAQRALVFHAREALRR